MGAGIAASPHCAERRICRCSVYLVPLLERFGTPLLDPGSPAQASLSTEPLSPKRSPDFYLTAPPEGSLVFRCPARLKTEVLAQNRPMFRGPSWDEPSRVPLRSPKFRGTPGAASHDRKIISSGASSRLAPKRTRKSLSIACRRRSVLLPLPRPSCRCRLSRETGTSAPITWSPCTCVPSRKSKIFGNKPVDNGDIGNNHWNLLIPVR
jgi:hypothetical protein